MSDSHQESDSVRLDIWLWSVRVFKTRNLAAQACRKGNVRILDHQVKPSRLVRVGDEISVKRRFLTIQLKVAGLLSRRVGAKLVPDFCEDLTPEEEIQAARERASMVAEAPKRGDGKGRPTKKDRRDMDEVEEAEDRAKREELFEKWMRETEF
tara:strand:+ start:16582 stop:17040 length:459 start_codon:yes stop_codon:yes gene_type:complete